jgi:hypothetical protein
MGKLSKQLRRHLPDWIKFGIGIGIGIAIESDYVGGPNASPLYCKLERDTDLNADTDTENGR